MSYYKSVNLFKIDKGSAVLIKKKKILVCAAMTCIAYVLKHSWMNFTFILNSHMAVELLIFAFNSGVWFLKDFYEWKIDILCVG